MSEFATSAAVDVTVSPDSLRKARGTIEDELGDIEVGVSTTGGRSGGGGRMAGRERAMGRQLDTTRNEHLAGIDGHWTENLDLNRERNDLLRQLVDVTEKDAQTVRGGGGGLSGGALGLAIGGVGLGSMLLSGLGSSISDAIGELDPRDWNIPSPVPDDWDMPSPVPTDWQIPDLVPDNWNMPSPVPDDWNLPSPVPDNWNLPSPVPDNWNLPSPVPDNWNMPSPVPDDWDMPSPVPDDWGIPSPVPDDWNMPSPVPDDWGIPDIEITKPDWIPIPIGSPGGSDSPSSDGTGSPTPDWIPSKDDVGTGVAVGTGAGAAAGAAWLTNKGKGPLKNIGKGGGSKVASRTGGLPVALAEGIAADDPEGTMIGETAEGVFRTAERSGVDLPGNRPWNQNVNRVTAEEAKQQASEREWPEHTIPDSDPGLFDQLAGQALGRGAGYVIKQHTASQKQGPSSNNSSEEGNNQNVSAEQTNHFEINADTSNLEREFQSRMKEVEKELEKLSRALNP